MHSNVQKSILIILNIKKYNIKYNNLIKHIHAIKNKLIIIGACTVLNAVYNNQAGHTRPGMVCRLTWGPLSDS